MTSHLLDTDVCISVLRGHEGAARDRLRAMSDPGISSVTMAELAYGAARSREPERSEADVRLLVSALTIVPFDEDAAWHAGDIRAELAAAGTPIGAYDLLIAGAARSRGSTLVTGNLREFSRVEGLSLERW